MKSGHTLCKHEVVLLHEGLESVLGEIVDIAGGRQSRQGQQSVGVSHRRSSSGMLLQLQYVGSV